MLLHVNNAYKNSDDEGWRYGRSAHIAGYQYNLDAKKKGQRHIRNVNLLAFTNQ